MNGSRINRRALLVGATLTAPMLLQPARALAANGIEARLSDLEKQSGGRLGVAVFDSQTGLHSGHRADERFAMCSTFKLIATAFILARADRRQEKLDRRIVFTTADLVGGAITKDKVGEPGMTIAELCEAAVTVSDNTAANLLLVSFGGPPGLTAYARSLGDDVTRLDRTEPTLNEAAPGDPRDTTTPAAMIENMRKLILGDALLPSSRDQLIRWLVANKTGTARLRAGLPANWRVGDKTGTGEHGATNDIAILWPPDRAPILVTAYFTESALPDDERNAVLAEVGRIVAKSV